MDPAAMAAALLALVLTTLAGTCSRVTLL